jgi:hypothetical protein
MRKEMPMTEQEKQKIDEFVEAMRQGLYAAGNWTFDGYTGVLRDETQGPWVKATPTGRTFVIRVDGGARNFRKTIGGTFEEGAPAVPAGPEHP